MAGSGADNGRHVSPYGTGRSTAPRRAVAAAAVRFPGAFTAEELTDRVRDDAPRVSTATVYRSIAAMAASGYLAPVGERDGATLYARCGEAGHHHHVVCTGCGATAPAPCPVDGAALAALTPAGFSVTSHEVLIYGLCAACGGRDRDSSPGAASRGASAATGNG